MTEEKYEKARIIINEMNKLKSLRKTMTPNIQRHSNFRLIEHNNSVIVSPPSTILECGDDYVVLSPEFKTMVLECLNERLQMLEEQLKEL